MEHPMWTLSDELITQAAEKGFAYEESEDSEDERFLLKRKADDARIWPHIDGFISCFMRQGMYVKHKKFMELSRALDRRFGD